MHSSDSAFQYSAKHISLSMSLPFVFRQRIMIVCADGISHILPEYEEVRIKIALGGEVPTTVIRYRLKPIGNVVGTELAFQIKIKIKIAYMQDTAASLKW